MRNIAIFGVLFCAGAFAAFAQTDQQQNESDANADALQRELEAKAVRIPKSGLAAALSASEGGRSDRGAVRRIRPDWRAVREDLNRTIEEDDATEAPTDEAGDDPADRPSEIQIAPPRQLGLATRPRPGLRARAPERMARVSRGEVDEVTIPVLAPAAPEVRDKLKMYGQENAFTASGAIDDAAHVSVSGACDRVIGGAPPVRELRRRIADSPPRLAGMRAGYHISRNEFATDLSFSKFGCGYVITIECADPDTDERCTGDDYIIELAQSMWVLNSERAGEEE